MATPIRSLTQSDLSGSIKMSFRSNLAKVGEDSTGTQHFLTTNTDGDLALAPLANERDIGTANAHGVSVPECNGTTCNYTSGSDVNGDGTASSDAPALLFGVYVNTTLSAHALQLRDGTTTAGTLKVTIPASAAAGTMYTFPGIKFNTGIFVDWNASVSAGDITVMWRAKGANS